MTAIFFFSSRRRHTRSYGDWSSDVCSSDLAETLLGQGDMLFRPVGTSRLQRLQGAFVTEDEIARLVAHWGRQGEPEFDEALLEVREETADDREGELSPDHDDLLDEAARIVVQSQTASVSMIQRRLRVGYTRAGRL